MSRLLLALLIALTGLASCTEGRVIKTAAAYEVPTSGEGGHARLLAVMQKQAAKSGYHVDHASKQDLAVRSDIAPRTFSAGVWAGANDDENIATAMNEPSGSDRIWLTFAAGQNPDQADRFRISLMQEVRAIWPETKELPILNGETIPLPGDLILDGDRYILDPSAADRYDVPSAASADSAPPSSSR